MWVTVSNHAREGKACGGMPRRKRSAAFPQFPVGACMVGILAVGSRFSASDALTTGLSGSPGNRQNSFRYSTGIGALRTEPHRDRKLSAAEAVEMKPSKR